MWRALCVVGLLGCGRFDFDARALPSAGDGAVADDGVVLWIVDCTLTPIVGATVVTSPASRAVYADTAQSPDGSLAATTSSGVVYLLDVPTGPLTITAAAAGLVFPPAPLTVHPNPDVSSTNVYASP